MFKIDYRFHHLAVFFISTFLLYYLNLSQQLFEIKENSKQKCIASEIFVIRRDKKNLNNVDIICLYFTLVVRKYRRQLYNLLTYYYAFKI